MYGSFKSLKEPFFFILEIEINFPDVQKKYLHLYFTLNFFSKEKKFYTIWTIVSKKEEKNLKKLYLYM